MSKYSKEGKREINYLRGSSGKGLVLKVVESDESSNKVSPTAFPLVRLPRSYPSPEFGKLAA